MNSFNRPQAAAWPEIDLPTLSSQAKKSKTVVNFVLPMLSAENSQALLQNPDRGLRMESYITLTPKGAPESYPGNSQSPYEKMLGFIEKYEEESPTIVQLYIYLSRYNDKPIDDHAFAQLEEMLELLRDNGIRVLLRFVYQNESNPDPYWPQVKEHLLQIGEWFQEKGQLIEDSLFVMQAGLVGYWGEGHSFVNFEKNYMSEAFNLLFSITPADVFVQLRQISFYNDASKAFIHRMGVHDDYVVGEQNGRWSFFEGHNNILTRRLEQQFKRTINDAEMPWGRATYYDKADGHSLDNLDALAVIKQLFQYSTTTLSLEHNYREGGPGHLYSMARWKDDIFTKAQLEKEGLPYHPALFDANDRISAFEYIQYHLGYLLSLSSFELDEASNKLSFTIQNNGFAPPLNFNVLSLVISGEEYLLDSYDKYALASMQAVTYEVDLPEDFAPSQSMGIKIAHCAGSSISARFINDTAYENGVQALR